jgi:hypothetical protein
MLRGRADQRACGNGALVHECDRSHAAVDLAQADPHLLGPIARSGKGEPQPPLGVMQHPGGERKPLALDIESHDWSVVAGQRDVARVYE